MNWELQSSGIARGKYYQFYTLDHWANETGDPAVITKHVVNGKEIYWCNLESFDTEAELIEYMKEESL